MLRRCEPLGLTGRQDWAFREGGVKWFECCQVLIKRLLCARHFPTQGGAGPPSQPLSHRRWPCGGRRAAGSPESTSQRRGLQEGWSGKASLVSFKLSPEASDLQGEASVFPGEARTECLMIREGPGVEGQPSEPPLSPPDGPMSSSRGDLPPPPLSPIPALAGWGWLCPACMAPPTLTSPPASGPCSFKGRT